VAIALRKPADIEKLREANLIVAQTLDLLRKNAKVGATLHDLDAMAEEFILSSGAKPSFKGLYGFPNAVCTSLNQTIIHGIPSDYALKSGDVIGFDVGTKLGDWFGDAAITVGVGEITKEDEALISCAEDTLYYAIENIKQGMRFKELSHKIENYILEQGFQPLKGFCGHGIGKKPHEEPEIPNYLDGDNPKQGPKIKNGMVFCLEPMITQKSRDPEILDDKWSVISKDGLNTSHYEHTVAVINGRAEILSKL